MSLKKGLREHLTLTWMGSLGYSWRCGRHFLWRAGNVSRELYSICGDAVIVHSLQLMRDLTHSSSYRSTIPIPISLRKMTCKCQNQSGALRDLANTSSSSVWCSQWVSIRTSWSPPREPWTIWVTFSWNLPKKTRRWVASTHLSIVWSSSYLVPLINSWLISRPMMRTTSIRRTMMMRLSIGCSFSMESTFTCRFFSLLLIRETQETMMTCSSFSCRNWPTSRSVWM